MSKVIPFWGFLIVVLLIALGYAVVMIIIYVVLPLLAIAILVGVLIKFGPALVLRLRWLLWSIKERRPLTLLAFNIWMREIEHRKKIAESEHLQREAKRLEDDAARRKQALEHRQSLELEAIGNELTRLLRPPKLR